MRRAAGRDANHAEIRDGLRALGWTVLDLGTVGGGCPDVLVGAEGVNVLLEIKDGSKPPAHRRLRPAQREFLAVQRTGNAALASAARQRLMLLGMPPGLVNAVARSGRVHDVTTLTTPSGGVIDTLDVRPGMTLAMGQPLARIVGLGSVWLDAAVPEARIGDVRPGAAVTADLTAFPGEHFPGRVQAILPTAQSESRTVTVRVELQNRGLRLRPGMFARVSLGRGSTPALLIPTEAVIRTGKRAIVMLSTGDGRYHPAEVQIGRESGGRTEIVAGLAEGEKVVASGQFLLDSEASLTGIPVRAIGASATSSPK